MNKHINVILVQRANNIFIKVTQVWRYKRASTLMSSATDLPVVDLFRAAGISFDFSEGIIKPLIEAVSQEWEKLV